VWVLRLGLLSVWLSLATPAWAQTPAPSASARTEPPKRPYPRGEHPRLDVPALDVRANAVLGYWPSMRQSMAVTKDAYYVLHGAIMAIPYPDSLPSLLVGAIDYTLITFADYFSTAFPPFHGWHHEEWHRAVLSRRGIGSYNDVYDIPLSQSAIAVSHLKDEDLIWLKRMHPADQVRLSSAGIEADFERQIELDKDRFFHGTRAGTVFLEWLSTFNAILYMQTAAGNDSIQETLDLMDQEGESMEARDFTGLDPDGWVYDLFRPGEPYEARGVHPTGVGIDRYRTVADLTRRERRYLAAVADLSWLNLVNPNLFGFYQFQAGRVLGAPFRFNASLHSVMAPFGYTVGLNLFAKAGRYKLFGGLQSYMSESLVLPGLSA
jgi:hypothetical protein